MLTGEEETLSTLASRPTMLSETLPPRLIVQNPPKTTSIPSHSFIYPAQIICPQSRSRRYTHRFRQPPHKSTLFSTHIPPCPLITLRCFSTASLASRNRSTQFCTHGSSRRSRLLDEMFPVTHFFQQMSVSSCTAGGER